MPLHGDCSEPVTHEVRGRESDLLERLKGVQWAKGDDVLDYAPGYGWIGEDQLPAVSPRSITAYVTVRCRRCELCLAYRRRLWTARAIAETNVSHRTWFGTLTFRPSARFRVRMVTDEQVRRRRCERIEDVDQEEQFKLMARTAARDVTLFLKRVRKNSGAALRYLLVTEAHEDGFPHFHLLLHESSDRRVVKQMLEDNWRAGFSHWRLVNNQDAKVTGYVCKYLSKSASTRVRASQKYGDVTSRLSERLRDAVASEARKRGKTCLSE